MKWRSGSVIDFPDDLPCCAASNLGASLAQQAAAVLP
jgi:hypothetical protein